EVFTIMPVKNTYKGIWMSIVTDSTEMDQEIQYLTMQ
ncbi:MAG: hypothetical protein ACJA2S_000460, partial [Cyclobacteriaceae bacterium]